MSGCNGQKNGAERALEERWCLPVDVELIWQSWDDEVIVYNTASGQTHLLDALSGTVLKEIENHPGTIPQLAKRLSDKLGLDSQVLLDRLADICNHFDNLGLAEPSIRERL